MRVAPRPAQQMAIKAALKGLRSRFKRALVVLATGLGKTLAAAFIVRQFRPKRVLFLVHNNFILQHALEEFRLVFHKKTEMATFNGLSKDGAASADMVFATWQTMGKNLRLWKRDHFDLIVVDEAHHTEADTYRPVVDYFTGARLGITATPDRVDDADIRDVFGPEVVNVTLEEAIARGWLPRIEYHVVADESLNDDALQKIAREIRRGKKRFTMAEVNRRIFIHKRDEEIARIIDAYPEKSIVFCASIKHAERMRKSLKKSAVFHSMTGSSAKVTWRENQATLDALGNGKVRRVCAVNAFNEGVDVPSVGLVAFCRVTGSLTIFRQQLGRGLRPGKDKLIVLDFVGNLERIQQVLEMMNKISDLHEKFTPRKEREREGYERRHFEVTGKGFKFTFSDKVVDLIQIARHVGREFYPTWKEAGVVAKKLGIKTALEYKRRFREDPKLPSNPNSIYQDFPGWVTFLGKKERSLYATWQEAARAARKLGIKSQLEYYERFSEDPRLHSGPHRLYKDFPGYKTFLEIFYVTWQQASRAAQKLGVKTKREYEARYKEDSQLTVRPQSYYSDFPGWHKYLGKTTHRSTR